MPIPTTTPTTPATWPSAETVSGERDTHKRDTWQALTRGLRCRCPNCGEGKLFRAYLKVADRCPACREDFSHHRADDFPAYLVIVIVGHIVVPLLLAVETNFEPSFIWHIAMWLPLTLGLSLALLPPVKGAVVALQWAFRMHGFDNKNSDNEKGVGELK